MNLTPFCFLRGYRRANKVGSASISVFKLVWCSFRDHFLPYGVCINDNQLQSISKKSMCTRSHNFAGHFHECKGALGGGLPTEAQTGQALSLSSIAPSFPGHQKYPLLRSLYLVRRFSDFLHGFKYVRVCLQGGGGSQVGEVTRLAVVEK